MSQQLHLFEAPTRTREWAELPAGTRVEVLRLLALAASRMLRNREESDHERCGVDEDTPESAT